MSHLTKLDILLCGISLMMLGMAVYSWITAKRRTKYHVHAFLVSGGLVLLQLQDLLMLPGKAKWTARVILLVWFVGTMWFQAGLKKGSSPE